MIPGYYINQQNQLAILMPDKTTYVWSELTNDWITFKMTHFMECVFDWDYMGEL